MEDSQHPARPTSFDSAVGGAPQGPIRVGFWPRFGAAMIDGAVVVLLGVALANLVASLFPGYIADAIARQQAKLDPKVAAKMSAMSDFVRWSVRWPAAVNMVEVFYGLLEGLFGRALGKLLLGLRIAGPSGQVASVGRLLGRMAVKQSGALVVMAGMLTGSVFLARVNWIPDLAITIGFLLVFGQRRQALHDMAAGTAVYRNTDVIDR
jgi:uncharacterized RDD family membrane protein YckC